MIDRLASNIETRQVPQNSMTSNSLVLSRLVPGADLQHYIHAVHAFPILSEDRERDLARRLYEENDLDAARELVLAHLRFVVHISQSYAGYGLPQEDLIQEGNVGLMKAVNRFDPNRGVRLVTFAVHWIKAEINEYVIRNWRLFKVATNKAQRKLFYKLRSKKNELGQLNTLTTEETKVIAKDLGVRPDQVREMEERLSGQDISIDLPNDSDDSGEEDAYIPRQVESTLVDHSDPAEIVENQQWSALMHEKLQNALESLDERSREIVYGRWIHEDSRTLDDLGNEFGISAERVRQLEKKALLKIKNFIGEDLALA